LLMKSASSSPFWLCAPPYRSHTETQKHSERERGEREGGRCVLFTRATAELKINDDDDDV
jgi:hypothetical protein